MRRVWMLVSLCVAISARPVCAWNDLGHMTVARIAYERLTEAERATIAAILRNHPHYHELLLKDRPPQASEQEWIFLSAATWPDHVRPPRTSHEPVSSHRYHRFHHPTWHYANFEYHAGQRESTLPSHPLPHPFPHSNPAESTDIIQQLDHSYMIVRGTERERSDPELTLLPAEIRAVRMCWLFHLIGDIHQPLHVATLVDDRIPLLRHGDEGGNKLAIRLAPNTAPRKLHAFWDDLLGTHPHFERVVQLAEMFSHDPNLAAARLPEFAARRQAWEFAQESYQLAKEVVYQNGQLPIALWSEFESRELKESEIPVLSKNAIERSHALAARRITLAGYRLADRLTYIASREHGRDVATSNRSAPTKRGQPTTYSDR